MHILIGQNAHDAENGGMELKSMIAALKADGMKYAQIGEAVGVSQPTITRWAQGAKPDYEKIEQVRALYRRRLGLTNETGTSTLGHVIGLRGVLRVDGVAEWFKASDIKQIRVGLYLPEGAFGFEAAETLSVFRARAGDLIILAADSDPKALVDREALVDYEDKAGARSAFVTILEERGDGTFMLAAGAEIVSRQARVTAAHRYIATLSKDDWLRVP